MCFSVMEVHSIRVLCSWAPVSFDREIRKAPFLKKTIPVNTVPHTT